MHKKLTLLLFALLSGSNLHAQSMYVIDSLKQAIESAKGTRKADMLLDLSQELWGIDTLQANNYAREAFALSKKLKYPKGLVWGMAYQGVPHEYFGKPEVALTFYRKGLEIAKEYKFKKGIAESYGNLGIAHHSMNQDDSATVYYHRALHLIDEMEDYFMKYEQVSNLGSVYYNQARYDSALHYMSKAREAASIIGDSSGMASSYSSLGNIEMQLGRMGYAAEFYFEALNIYKRLRNDGGIAATYNVLGILYDKKGEYQKAVEYYKKAFIIREKIGNQITLPNSLNNLGQAYMNVEEYDSAMQYLQQGLKIAKQQNNLSLQATFLHNLAHAQGREGKYEKALDMYKESLEISQKINDKYSLGNTNLSIGETYFMIFNKRKDKALLDSSESHFKQGLAIAQEIGVKSQIEWASSSLGYVYKRKEMYKDATDMFILNMKMSDSLSNEKQQELASELDAKYQMRQNTLAMAALKKEQELNEKRITQQMFLNIALGFILLLAITLTIVLYKNNQRAKVVNAELARQRVEIQQRNEEILIQQEAIERQNQTLALQNENLKMLDDEKNYLIGVVAHDLKSPINQLKGLLSIVMFDADKLSDNAKKMLELANQVLGNTSEMVAKILDLKAIESQTLNLQMEKYDVKAQLTDIVDSFEGLAAQKEIPIDFQVEAENLVWKLDKNLVEQIMENLISNAIKFSPKGKPVSITAGYDQDNLLFTVSDKGPGVHPDEAHKLFKKYQRLSAKPTGGESSTGLGLSIVKKYAVAMNGDVWCESVWGKGATFKVKFNPEGSSIEIPQIG